MGGAVSINADFQTHNTQSVFELFNNKKKTEEMFEEVASYGQQSEGMRGKKDKIDLAELLLFITKEVNPEFTNAFVKNTIVIKQAFIFSMRGEKSKSDEMSLKQFKKLIPALLLFSHLWHIFETVDDNVSDGRIFKPEFIRAKQQIIDGKIEGVTMSEISDEDWAKEFDVINKNAVAKVKSKKKKQQQQSEGDNFISFREFVAYALKNIMKPAVYVVGQSSAATEGNEGDTETEVKSKPSAFVRMMSGLIDEMEENDIEEAKNEEALAELEKTEDENEIVEDVTTEVKPDNSESVDNEMSGKDEGETVAPTENTVEEQTAEVDCSVQETSPAEE